MWTVVFMAQSRQIAEELREVLMKEGILVKLRSINKEQESDKDYFEVLVLETEVEEAHSIIIEKGF